MASSRYYRVADHVFALAFDEAVADQMTNYAPFRISEQEAQNEEIIFSLTLTDDPLTDGDITPVFSDVSEEDMPRIEVNRVSGDAWLFCVAVTKSAPINCRLLASADFKQARLHILANDYRFAINNAVMLLFAFSTVQKKTLEMHAAVVVRDEKGYLFLGKSGTGKSTHARQWLQAFPDSWLLNDDNPILRLTEQGLRVYGSPWSGKTPCYLNRSAAVGGIIKLSQAPHNEARRMTTSEAYAYMLSSSSGLKIDPVTMDAMYETISELVLRYPVHHLDCLPNTDAAEVCYKAITTL